MALLKGATQQLRAAGIEHVEVHRYGRGYALYDPRHKVQQNTVYGSAAEVVAAALAGERPRRVR